MIFKESKSIFIQIADRICDEILEKKYLEGERIPSVREYCALVEVNVNTAMRSYDFLHQQGILHMKRGIGYFVAEDAVEQIILMKKQQFKNEVLPELFRQMKLLGISLDELKDLY